MFNHIVKTLNLPDGRTITIETGKLARQADGAVVVRMGDTMLLATVVSARSVREGQDFFPLSVDYQEKFASAGKIPGSFHKREGRLSDHEILTSRLVDRVLRPLFPSDYRADTQVLIQLISFDPEVMPEPLAGLAASAALTISDIPFNGPISEVKIVRVNGEFIINPSKTQVAEADVDLLVGASMDNVVMVEGEMSEVSEEEVVEMLKVAHEAVRAQIKLQLELKEAVGAKEVRTYTPVPSDEALKTKLFDAYYERYYAVAKKCLANKKERKEAFGVISKEFFESLGEDSDVNVSLAKGYFHDIEKEASRNLSLNDGLRLDGRKPDEIREITCEIDYLPGAHGSALFTRGETQSLTSITLGSKNDEMLNDQATGSSYSKFYLHYNFPPFSTGETKPMRGPGRREVGHGNLAYRALKRMVPSTDKDLYTVRIVSDILESNGSSSMATVCAGSLGLMDAGINVKSGVSGIAMGLITDKKTGKFVVLSDILGDEDHLGDMDFKVTGTEKGITACQMDIKIEGLSYEILTKALMQAKEGRAHILNIMNKTINTAKADVKEHAPRVETIVIARDQIGSVIGPGGKVIQEIQKTSGATIVIEEKNKEGIVSVFATDKVSMGKAVDAIKKIVMIPEIGEVYKGKVKTVAPYGAFIEFLPGKDGLLHISEIRWEKVDTMDGVFEEGEEVMVQLLDVDRKTGKFKLSRKALLPKPEVSEQS